MSSTDTAQRLCLECESALFGREDKKFCSDQCRNAFNNRQNKDSNSYVRKVNAILRKNRRILVEMNPTGKKKVRRDDLIKQGFDFDHFTSMYTTKNGKTYHYCYDQGYLEISPGWLVLVFKQDFSA